jgi:hypothetical protein
MDFSLREEWGAVSGSAKTALGDTQMERKQG